MSEVRTTPRISLLPVDIMFDKKKTEKEQLLIIQHIFAPWNALYDP
jgi:hypothetical protein